MTGPEEAAAGLPSILVVGAGVAGLALARALAQHGLPCTVVDQRAAAPGLGMGLNLPGNAVRALAALGVADLVGQGGVPVRRREYRTSTGRLLFHTDDAEFWRGVGTPVCVRHGRLLAALGPQIHVDRATRVVSVATVPGKVEVQLDGEPGPRRYDLVVGADGVNSTLRTAVSEQGSVSSAMTQSGWRFVVDNPGVDCWTAWSGAAGTFLLIPVERGRVYGYAASTRGGGTGAEPGWLADTFAGFPQQVTQTVGRVLAGEGERHHAPVVEVRLERWHHERLVLVGDAAHATGPVWAQGAAMALEDALVLAEVLAASRDWSGAGAAFEQRRRARVDHVQAATDRFSRLARLPTRLRDLAAPRLGPRAYRQAYGPLLVDPLAR